MNILYLYIFLSAIYLTVYLSINKYIYLSISPPMYVYIFQSYGKRNRSCLPIYDLYTYLSNYIYIVIYLCVHLFISMYILGVWAREYIPKGTRFGPMLGEIHPKHNDISGKRKNA